MSEHKAFDYNFNLSSQNFFHEHVLLGNKFFKLQFNKFLLQWVWPIQLLKKEPVLHFCNLHNPVGSIVFAMLRCWENHIWHFLLSILWSDIIARLPLHYCNESPIIRCARLQCNQQNETPIRYLLIQMAYQHDSCFLPSSVQCVKGIIWPFESSWRILTWWRSRGVIKRYSDWQQMTLFFKTRTELSM